ncbi:hypothetical protein FACS1894172_02960 [Spirochaetia bacterium]|nr:hypothetical protein FACS1894172_02960 [Spirochaetia bacterium]
MTKVVISDKIVEVMEGIGDGVCNVIYGACDVIDNLTTAVIGLGVDEKTPKSGLGKWKVKETESGLVITGYEAGGKTDRHDDTKVVRGLPITCTRGANLKLTIPAEIAGQKVVGIGDYAFYQCKELISITIPFGVTRIGESAFNSCSYLARVTIPDSVRSIGESAFATCWELKSVVIPTGVITISDWTFAGCVNMKSVTIPDTVTKIGAQAFQGCGSLTTVAMPRSVTDIGESAFYDCKNLAQPTRDLLRQKFGEDVLGSSTTYY